MAEHQTSGSDSAGQNAEETDADGSSDGRSTEDYRSLLDEAHAGRARAETVERRLRFLDKASAVLSSSLDYDTTLARVAQLAVPELADWASVDILEDDGEIRQLAVAHVDPAKVEWAKELRKRHPPNPDDPTGLPAVIRTGRSEIIPAITQEMLAGITDTEMVQILDELGLNSVLIVPLNARERTLGAITFVQAESGRHYDDADLALAENLAGRAALAVDNARLYRDAREALHQREAFFSAISHDLRTPLASIKGLTQSVIRLLERSNSPEAGRMRERLVLVDGSATRMAAMIDELLDLSRMEAGRPFDLDREPVDLIALVRRVAADQQQLTQQHLIEVQATVDQLIGMWDPARLERVLANLLNNAVKYTPDGGVVVVLVILSEMDGSGNRWAEVRVQDEGIGIPAEDLPRIFDRYHRAANASAGIPGVGIGLASAKQIVELHGGTISVESQEGNGSIFIMRLPVGGRKPEQVEK